MISPITITDAMITAARDVLYDSGYWEHPMLPYIDSELVEDMLIAALEKSEVRLQIDTDFLQSNEKTALLL
jgi:hypothetical protein